MAVASRHDQAQSGEVQGQRTSGHRTLTRCMRARGRQGLPGNARATC